MMKWLTGFFVEEKMKVISIGTVILLVFVSLGAYCFSITMRNKTLTLEIQKLTLQLEHPTIIEKPKVIVKYIDRVITKTVEGEGQTLILETERTIESNGGKDIIPITGDNQSPDKNWTAGVSYDSNGDMGVLLTRRVFKTIELGIQANGNVAGVVGTIKW